MCIISQHSYHVSLRYFCFFPKHGSKNLRDDRKLEKRETNKTLRAMPSTLSSLLSSLSILREVERGAAPTE